MENRGLAPRGALAPTLLKGRPRGNHAGRQRKSSSMRATIIHRVTAVSNLPEHVPDQIKFGDGVQSGLNNNPHFPLPDPIITAFTIALGNYSVAETAAQTRAKGTIPARNAAKVVFVGALHALKARVQQVADASPENAEAIITSTNLMVRKTAIRQRQTFMATPGTVSGAVHVTAQSAGPRACYEWQYSIDTGKTWVQAPNTMQAKTTILNLPVAIVVEFRYRVTTKSGMGGWRLP